MDERLVKQSLYTSRVEGEMSSKGDALFALAIDSEGGRCSGRRPMPRRGQIKTRIAMAAMASITSVLWRAIHSRHILVRNPF